jgi:hypothetical protein
MTTGASRAEVTVRVTGFITDELRAREMDLLCLSSLYVTLLPLHPGAALPAAARTDDGNACQTSPEAVVAAAPTAPLRPLRRWIHDVIRAARPASATLDRLIRAAESTGAVIYIDEAEAGHSSWGGRTIFTAATGGYIYLRIELHRLPPNDTAALLAHELQHALEIVSSGVKTSEEVAQLYQRIGVKSRGYGERQFDTTAAVGAGRATLLELRRRGTRAPAVMASE